MTHMKRAICLFIPIISAALLLAADEGFVDKFDVPAQNFSTAGKSKYFILQPGYQMTLEGVEDGKKGRLILSVLDETKKLDGVETRVVEERETQDDQLVEISKNYFAIDKTTSNIYYFGEDVDMYKDGKVTSHEGSWHAGVDGAKYGMFMPGDPKVGQKFYQEQAPKVAMDRVEVLTITDSVKVPAGDYKDCLKTEETTPLEAAAKENKSYAPDIGLLIDGELKLVKYGQGR